MILSRRAKLTRNMGAKFCATALSQTSHKTSFSMALDVRVSRVNY